MIYLDHAATTPLAEEALAAMLPFLTQQFANPASDHPLGRAARAAVEHARVQVAALLGASAEEIIFTSGATEANNLAIKGALEFRSLADAHIVTTKVEHKCVLDTCRYLETRGVRVTYLKPNADGSIAADVIMAAVTAKTVLVSLMWVNNELGCINPIVELAPLLRARGVLLHVDAVQAAGKLPIDLAHVPVDLLSVSAHKIYGPKGIGALFVRKRPRARVSPQLHGGGHEQGMRSGTLSPHQIVGFGAAAVLAAARMADAPAVAVLRDLLWQRLSVLPDIYRNSEGPTVAHILNVSFAQVEGEALRALLPNLAVSSGSACSSATAEPSYVLRALGRSDALANAALRFSLGRATTAEHINRAADQVLAAVQYLRGVGSASPAAAPMADCANVYGYSAPVWQRFCNYPVGRGAAIATAYSLEVSDRANGVRITLHFNVQRGCMREVRAEVWGCPVAIAVGAWLMESLEQADAQKINTLRADSLIAALEIPPNKHHCALIGEDAIHRVTLP